MFGVVGRTIRAHVRTAGTFQGLFFSERLSSESVRVACEKLQHEFRERVFSPAVTLWVFLAQVLSSDHSCREAVAKLNLLADGAQPKTVPSRHRQLLRSAAASARAVVS